MHLLSISHLSISQRCPKGSGGISLSPAPLVVVLEVKSEPLLCYVVRVWTTWKILKKTPRANQGRITNEITMWEYGTNTFLFILQPGYDIVFPSRTEWTYLLILLNFNIYILKFKLVACGYIVQGWIYRGVHRVRTPVGLGQQGCNGGAKNQIQKYGTISKVFPFLKSNWSS